MNYVEIQIVTLIALMLLMLVFWLISGRGDNSAWVDLAWAGCIGLAVIIYAGLINWNTLRHFLIVSLPMIWSIRLMSHLYVDRIKGSHKDGRYIELKRSWGDSYRSKFLLFFMVQGVLGYIISLQFFLALTVSYETSYDFQIVLATLLYLIAIIGESVADRQLYTYKQANPSKQGVCNVGLWKYSRHPNYFFEWLHWLAYVALMIDTPYWWVSLLVSAMMLYLVLFVTGIPPTEEQSLRSRGLAYQEYQKTTSAFFPWFPRSNKNS